MDRGGGPPMIRTPPRTPPPKVHTGALGPPQTGWNPGAIRGGFGAPFARAFLAALGWSIGGFWGALLLRSIRSAQGSEGGSAVPKWLKLQGGWCRCAGGCAVPYVPLTIA